MLDPCASFHLCLSVPTFSVSYVSPSLCSLSVLPLSALSLCAHSLCPSLRDPSSASPLRASLRALWGRRVLTPNLKKASAGPGFFSFSVPRCPFFLHRFASAWKN